MEEELLTHIPGLLPRIVTRAAFESEAQKEEFAKSMCSEVATKYNTNIAYFCLTGRTAELQEKFDIKTMKFIDRSDLNLSKLLHKANSLVNRSFVRLIVIDCLDAWLADVDEEDRPDEIEFLLNNLGSFAWNNKVPIVLLSNRPNETPLIDGMDLFTGQYAPGITPKQLKRRYSSFKFIIGLVRY